MSAMTDYLELKVLDHVLGTTAYTMPTNTWLSLHTTTPTDSAAGTEVSTGAYARQNIDFGAASAGVAANSNALTFTATGASWGSVTSWGIWDAVTAGNRLIWGSFTTARTINDGESLTVAIGAITVTAD